MRDAISLIRRIDDYCPICKKNYALELYNGYGKKLNYFRSLNENDISNIERERNLIMICRYCNNEFTIDRTDIDKYIPLIENSVKDDSYNKFITNMNNRKNNTLRKYRVYKGV